jgi:hypothetical protein
VNNILQTFFEELTKEEKKYMYFQQDNTQAHTAENSMQALQTVFNK